MKIAVDDKTLRMERGRHRRSRIVTHRAAGFDEAETWDLEYWQSKTPQERLSALVAIREDVKKAKESKREYEQRA